MSGTQCYKMLSTMCPMHVIFGRGGRINFAGPTARKLFSNALIGQQFLDIFEIKRPREITTMDDLYQSVGKRLNLRLRTPPCRQLKGILMEGPEVGQMIVNLSFGINVLDAVQDYNLTAADFAPTDLTVEMLYLVEAKSAAMEASRQLSERLQKARMAAEAQALTDTLTGLKNRRGMDRMLSAMIDGAQAFAVMQIDLDYFKRVNDTLGHAAGDFVLQQVATVLQEECRKDDVVSRVGGDEFVLLFRTSVDRDCLASIASRIITKLETPFVFESNECRISASIGIVMSKQYDVPCADVLLGDADAATYAAKHAGRGGFSFYADTVGTVQNETHAVEGRRA